MQIILKGELPDLNSYINIERGNRFAAAKLKKTTTEALAWEIKNKRLPKITTKISRLIIKWYVKNKKKDYDNIVFGKKFLFDAMILANLIPNDNLNYIDFAQEEVLVDKENPRIEVEIQTIRS